jgi:hypothetical protein
VEFSVPPIEIVYVDKLSQLPGAIPQGPQHFTMLLAWDARESDIREFEPVALALVQLGLCYFCSWGENCELVHDVVDMCVVQREIELGEADFLLMTTWHNKESLEEAFEFFQDLALPAETHIWPKFGRYAVAIGNPAWEALIFSCRR